MGFSPSLTLPTHILVCYGCTSCRCVFKQLIFHAQNPSSPPIPRMHPPPPPPSVSSTLKCLSNFILYIKESFQTESVSWGAGSISPNKISSSRLYTIAFVGLAAEIFVSTFNKPCLASLTNVLFHLTRRSIKNYSTDEK